MLHLLDLLLPRRSPSGALGTWLTDEERAALREAPSVVYEQPVLRSRGVRFLDRLVGAGWYRTPLLRQTIARFKFGRTRPLADELGVVLTHASRHLRPERSAVLCPVPLHWLRRFHRGFDQCVLLAELVSQARGWPMVRLLRRVRSTRSQALRPRAERIGALTGVFRCVQPPPAHVILVDDIATTGTTLDRCAEELKRAGAERVEAIVLALG